MSYFRHQCNESLVLDLVLTLRRQTNANSIAESICIAVSRRVPFTSIVAMLASKSCKDVSPAARASSCWREEDGEEEDAGKRSLLYITYNLCGSIWYSYYINIAKYANMKISIFSGTNGCRQFTEAKNLERAAIGIAS